MKKKAEKIVVTVQDVTKQVYERFKIVNNIKKIKPSVHPTLGQVVTLSMMKSLYPACYAPFKSIKTLTDEDTIKLSGEEAKALEIPISGNPHLGIRVYTESACEKITRSMTPEATKEFLMIVRCVFHEKEVRDHVYPEAKTEKSGEPAKSETASSVVQVPAENKDYVALINVITEQNKLLSEQNQYQKALAESMAMLQSSIAEFLQAVKQTSADSTQQENQEKSETTDSTEEKPKFVLKLKRDIKDPIYKKNYDALKKYKESVLMDIPTAMHNSILSAAYTRMKNVYGVPADTYRNEYFADTGKKANSTLEIVHWLEFRNPAIHGLLRCCVETVMKGQNTLDSDQRTA